MADIFVSYARENRAIANALVATLENHGWSVWWDQLIPAGTLFDNDIEDNLRNAKCIIVLWSQASVGSNWVRAEALRGFDRNNLIPVIIEEVEVPPPFNVYQAVHLADLRKPWTGVDLDAVTAAVRLKLSQTHGPVTQTHGAATQTHGPATEPYSDYLPNLPVPQLAAGLKRLRIANYNINNLFSRSSSLLARELGEKGDYINDLHGLKNLLARKSYAGSTGDKIVHLLEKYEFHMPVRERKRIAEFTIYQADERLYSIARGRIRLLASGNSDWHGYIRPFSRLLSESSVANKARVIRSLDADILCLREVESATALRVFIHERLREDGPTFSQSWFEDDDKDSGSSMAVLSRYPIAPGRDFEQCEIYLPNAKLLHLLGVSTSGVAKRGAYHRQQLTTILEQLRRFDLTKDLVALAVSFGSASDDWLLSELLNHHGIYDVRSSPVFVSGTSSLGRRMDFHDPILVSQPLWKALRFAGLDQRGVYGHVTFPEVTGVRAQASTHGVVFADFRLTKSRH